MTSFVVTISARSPGRAQPEPSAATMANAISTARSSRSRTPKRLLQVGPEIGDVLDPDREPQQPVREAHRQPPLARHRGVRHRRRMADETLDAAQALGAREQLEAIEHRAPGVERAVAGDDRDHAAEAARLALRERVLRMAREPGVEHLRDAGMAR